MWWEIVFWVLLIPLVIAEIVIFVKTKRLYWLIYALSIFVYVVAVSYTLDVFDAGRNAVILTLIASAVLMALIGRHLGRPVQKRKAPSRGVLIAAGSILVLMVLLFTASVIFGRADETVTPRDSIPREDILTVRGEPEVPRRIGDESVTILTRTLANDFFLPVPIVSRDYKVCLVTSQGTADLFPREIAERNQEVPPGGTVTREVRVAPYTVSEETAANLTVSDVLVYEGVEGFMPCPPDRQPEYRIPVR